MYNLSHKFVVRSLELGYPSEIFCSSYVNSYLGADGFEYGRHLLLLYAGSVTETLSSQLKSSPYYSTTYCPKEGLVMFVFKITDDLYRKVFKPFIQGKYSEIDRGYVEKHYPRSPSSLVYTNRLILDKDDSLRIHWEDKLDVTLPPDAEVWSKCKFKDEYYEHKEPDLQLAEGVEL